MAKVKTKAVLGTNPKMAFGAQKVDLSLIPPPAMYYMARGLENGAGKYGPYNWRETEVDVRTYIAAMLRHIQAYLDGENEAYDSGVHHMGHVMAGAAIILDAMEHGTLVDNRPPRGEGARLMRTTHEEVDE